MRLKAVEILPLFISIIYLALAEIKIRFSSSKSILAKLKNLKIRKTPVFYLAPLHTFKLSRLVSLIEAADRRLGWKTSCLRRTLAMAGISSGLGLASEFKVGVRHENGEMRAH